MTKVVAVAVFVLACGDNFEPATPDATVELDAFETSCDFLERTTVDAPDIGEVLVEGRLITIRGGVTYTCDGGVTTYATYVRRMDGALGSYGRTMQGSTVCSFVPAIAERTPALGGCP